MKKILNIKSLLFLFIWAPILIIPILYSNSTIDANVHIRFVALSIYLLLLCVCSFFLLKQSNEVFFQKDILFVLFILYTTFSLPGILISPFSPSNGLFEWAKVILLPALIVLLTAVFRKQDNIIQELSKSITLLAFLVVFYGMYQFVQATSKTTINHQALYSITTTFAHKNIFSEMLLMMLPFSLYSLLSLKNFWRWAGLVSTFFSIVFIVILMTRAVWIALACSSAALLLLYVIHSILKRKISIDRKTFMTLLVFSGIISLSIGIYAYFDKENTFVKQVSNIFNFQYGSTKERVILWKNSFGIFEEYPFFGAGMGNWQIEILKYGNSGLVSEDTTTFYQRPHNDFIWILTEQGLFSFLVYLSIVAVVFYNIVRIIKHSQNNDERLFFYLMFFGFTGYCVFSLFSFPKERAEHLLLLSFLISSVLIYKRKLFPAPNNPTVNPFSFSILLLLLFAGIFSLTVSAMRLRSEQHLAEAFHARQAGDWKNMITKLDLAESSLYHIDQVSTPLRWYRGLANFNLNNMQEAMYDFKLAHSYNPYHVHVLNNLGTCYEMAGNHQDAISYFQQAVDLSPYFDEARFNLCASLYNAGEGKKAYFELRKINSAQMLQKYDHFLSFVLPASIKILKDTADKETRNQIERVQNTEGWMKKIHLGSIENNVSLEKQLILDLIYASEVIEKDTVEAKRLKNKYSTLLK